MTILKYEEQLYRDYIYNINNCFYLLYIIFNKLIR